MKQKLNFLLLILFACSARGSDFISIDDFKKRSFDEQAELIEKAPPEMKEELSRVYRQGLLTAKYGGEEGFKNHQEDRAVESRGLGYLNLFFLTQMQLFAQYWGAVSDQYAGMPRERQAVIDKPLFEENQALQKRYESIIRPLLVGLAPSQQALELAKKAEAVSEGWRDRYMLNMTVTPPKPAITKKGMDEVDQFTNQLIEELKTLPRLNPADVKGEINALPDEPLER